MGERIRQLEDALAILQAKGTNEPHPLLSDDAQNKSTPERDEDGPPVDSKDIKSPQDVIEAFGTLSVYDHGVSRFFGPSGGPEVRLTRLYARILLIDETTLPVPTICEYRQSLRYHS